MWAIVPVRSLTSAKSRLAGVLGSEARQRLQRALLTQTLHAIDGCASIECTLVVTADPEVKALAETAGATALIEPTSKDERPEGRLNAALDAAAAEASRGGAPSILVLPSDLPCLDSPTLDEVASQLPATDRAMAVIGDRHGDGTNALFCRPPELLRFAFGVGSCEEHLRRARAAGAEATLLHHPNVALDLDTPEDLAALRHHSAVPAAVEQLLDPSTFPPETSTSSSEPVHDSRALRPTAPSACPGD